MVCGNMRSSCCLFLLWRPVSPGGLTSHRALCPTCLKCGPRVVSDVRSMAGYFALWQPLINPALKGKAVAELKGM